MKLPKLFQRLPFFGQRSRRLLCLRPYSICAVLGVMNLVVAALTLLLLKRAENINNNNFHNCFAFDNDYLCMGTTRFPRSFWPLVLSAGAASISDSINLSSNLTSLKLDRSHTGWPLQRSNLFDMKSSMYLAPYGYCHKITFSDLCSFYSNTHCTFARLTSWNSHRVSLLWTWLASMLVAHQHRLLRLSKESAILTSEVTMTANPLAI